MIPIDEAQSEIDGLDFRLPAELEATEPPEARGLARDSVKLMVSHLNAGTIEHARFREIDRFLDPGDLLVINTSMTMNAALPALRSDGTQLMLHLSTLLPDGRWSVELRGITGNGTIPFRSGTAGETVLLPDGGSARLLDPYAPMTSIDGTPKQGSGEGVRLWRAELLLPTELEDYLDTWGSPIRYHYVKEKWPIGYYRTVYAAEPGSAEMPSAGRAFTERILSRLRKKGIVIAPLVLHTGVSSLEEHEPPYEEYYDLPASTAAMINAARAEHRPVIAVGTTVVRAIETVVDRNGLVQRGSGWTSRIITPADGVRVVDGLLTGLHEPRATHLAMLEAIAGKEALVASYAEALRQRYLWHEFGDLHLIRP